MSAGRYIRNLIERIFGSYYEGPDVPRRLGDEVAVFLHFNPEPTVTQWGEFARKLAAHSYREGWTRGYEWCERSWPGPAADPELLAEQAAQDWSITDIRPDYGARPSPLGGTMREQVELETALRRGGARIILPPPWKSPPHQTPSSPPSSSTAKPSPKR